MPIHRAIDHQYSLKRFWGRSPCRLVENSIAPDSADNGSVSQHEQVQYPVLLLEQMPPWISWVSFPRDRRSCQ
ncbi:unnamed protein product [Periconia digitata]|uniref:Uncharacterized protein n=1 Tax=Periconia digitata TaxID=1303443 RepID=A0A9W4U795_9PLEO|nr:unnamed protein product [Periconia digitata]